MGTGDTGNVSSVTCSWVRRLAITNGMGAFFQIVSFLGVEGEYLPCNLAIHNDERSDGPGAKAAHCRQPVAAIRRPEAL